MIFNRNKLKTYWSLASLQTFIHELHQLLRTGLPLFSALTLLQQHLSHEQDKMLAKQLQQKIAHGKTFSNAWQECTAEMLSATLLACGEQSGLLTEMLFHIKNYADKEKQIKQLIWQALRYPIFLLMMTCGLLTVLCSWVIPQFAELYKNFNVAMPALTQTILSACHWAQQEGFTLLVISLFLIIPCMALRKNNQINQCIQFIQRRFPLYRQTQELRFWHTSSLLLQAGIPFTSTLEICQKTVDDTIIKTQICYLIQALRHGTSLSSILKNHPIFSPKLVAMLSLGEVSGRLEEALQSYVTQQTEQIQTQIQSLKVWLEPICLCIIGGIVGTVLIALYLPIIELGKWV